MKFGRNKIQWASAKLTPKNSVIVCLKSTNSSSCLCFENIEQLAESIKKRYVRVKNWIVSVPNQCCITKSIELPANDIGQAYKMLEFELSSYLPLPVEELIYGCSLVKQNDNLLTVSVYILKIKTLENILAKFRTAGIRPTKVMVESVAMRSWFNQNRKIAALEIDLLLEKEHLYISAITNGNIQRYEKISLQDNNFESLREYIQDEIHYLATEITFDKEQPFFLKIAANKDIQADVRSWFDENFKSIECMELPELTSYKNSSNSPDNRYIFETVIAQGLIKSAEDPDLAFLNLLPKKILKRTQQIQLITSLAITATFAISSIFCLWLNCAIMNWQIQWACQNITKETAPIKHIAADIENKRQQVKAIQNQLSNRDQISRIFSQLYKYSPKEISISQMSYLSKIEPATINIKGQADTLSHAFEYSDAMKESALLNNIQIINAQQIPRPGGSIVEFKAECTVRGN